MWIHHYAADDRLAGVAAKLAAGVPVDARFYGMTPLMLAAQRELASPAMLQLLLDAGADPNAGNTRKYDHGATPLGYALRAGDQTKVALLLAAGANAAALSGWGRSHTAEAIRFRPGSGHAANLPLLRLLFGPAGGLDMATAGPDALLAASADGDIATLRWLLAAGVDPVAAEWTPLMRAIIDGDMAQFETLLDAGVDLEARNRRKQTAFLVAVMAGEFSMAQKLFAAGAVVPVPDYMNQNALNLAVRANHLPLLEWLIGLGLPLDGEHPVGGSPLATAAEAGHLQAISLLVAAGADLHAPAVLGDEAIAAASTLQVVQHLLALGANPNAISVKMRAALTGVPRLHGLYVRRQDGLQRRFGSANPEIMEEPGWQAMLACGWPAETARKFVRREEMREVWTWRRFGCSITLLPNGRVIEIAGEHEDYYHHDFCIFNDVVVHHPDGRHVIYGYPRDLFPPRDQHSATLVGDHIYIIGGQGYAGDDSFRHTPVYRLHVDSLQVEALDCSGEPPGRLIRHRARWHDGAIELMGGELLLADEHGEMDYRADHGRRYRLDLERLHWTRLPDQVPTS
ncbi:Ankyrin repeat-containing protein [Andreprevotia lacus DSM 23236]|jgi:ankyrin repeat protein|uniref:Ankyrin repeat-containing protein n=1 Tax=Andreprevotia lacus DSM 23236 TaxID=1121001 RepID=A0A1W1X980_9NEIS|nr:ankyrin repeat domain-containing protein [Andreprevotia lacus]SMC20393.1 Ankyrin repeat-containing protein [Andreprevotia lacus DSM 23236]